MTWGKLTRILLKATGLFLAVNLLWAVLNPALGGVSLYNVLVPGRERLPFGEDPASYNLILNDLDAMFASHALAGAGTADEFRVIVLGDSSVWGIQLPVEDTLTGQLNALDLTHDGQPIRAYNIGHPILSVTKDLLLLDYARRYDPDLIVWLVTLESLDPAAQLEPPLVQNNAGRVRELIARYELDLDMPPDAPPALLDRTLVAQRRPIADWLRLQLYGVAWAVTGIDQIYPPYAPLAHDLEATTTWNDYSADDPPDLSVDVLTAGIALADDIPVLIVNEPIFIADGANSDLRYNAWYPRWAYDAYRANLAALAEANGWTLLDLWNAVPPDAFTDSPVHLSPAGSRQLAEHIAAGLQPDQDNIDE
jgi:hypothetical protein